MPVSGDPGIPQAQGATVAKLYILPVFKKTIPKQGVRPEMPAGRLFHCRYSLQNRAVVKALNAMIMLFAQGVNYSGLIYVLISMGQCVRSSRRGSLPGTRIDRLSSGVFRAEGGE